MILSSCVIKYFFVEISDTYNIENNKTLLLNQKRLCKFK